MDFEPRHTAEQQSFREEVRAWLGGNVPPDLAHPADAADTTYDDYLDYRELGRRLGEKGWLWPTAPSEYGGGGLTIDHAIVLDEELDAYELSLPPYYDSGGRLGGASILVWGSDEQKQHFLPPILRETFGPGNFSPSRALAQTWRRFRSAPCATATTTSSTARRSLSAAPTARSSSG